MTYVSIDDFAGGSDIDWEALRVSPDTQARRDAEALRLMQGERTLKMPKANRAALEKDISNMEGRLARSGGGQFVRTSSAPKQQESSFIDIDAFAGEPPPEKKGFWENIRTDYGKMWLEESLPANLYQAWKAGTFKKKMKDILVDEPASMLDVDWSGLADQAYADPLRFLAELVNAIQTDPQFVFVPMKLGGKVAQTLAKVASAGGKSAAKAGQILGAMTESAIIAGGINAGISAGRQLKETGQLDTGKAGQEGILGAAMGAPFGALPGRTKTAKSKEKPLVESLPEREIDPSKFMTQEQLKTAANVRVIELLEKQKAAGLEAAELAELKALKEGYKDPEALARQFGVGLATEGEIVLGSVDKMLGLANKKQRRAFLKQREAELAAESTRPLRTLVEKEAALRDNAARAASDPQHVYEPKAPLNALEEVAWGDALRILRKPAFERTATDLVNLRAFNMEKYQRGSIDKKLAIGMGVAGAGALAGAAIDKDKLLGAVEGAAIALLAAKAAPRAILTADIALGMMSTRLYNTSKPLGLREQKFERRVKEGTYNAKTEVDPFLVELRKVPGETQGELRRAVSSGDTAKVNALLTKIDSPALTDSFRRMNTAIREIGTKLVGLKRFEKLKEGYFPRIVKDYKGLMNALGQEAQTKIELEILAAEKRSMSTRGTSISPEETSEIINRWMRQNYRLGPGQPGYAKGRKIGEITADLEPFYLPLEDAVHSHINRAINDIEKAAFFGKNLKVVKDRNRAQHTNDIASIGSILEEELSAGRINHEQMQEAKNLLQARFGPGEQMLPGWIQDLKNYAYIGLLANFRSAAQQSGDTLASVFFNDLIPTMKAITQVLTGRTEFDPKIIGMVNHISDEFVSNRTSAKWVNRTFKASAFSWMDNIGMKTFTNASLIKNKALVSTGKGVDTLRQKWGEAFGEDFPRLVQDLRRGELTERVRTLVFGELSKYRPTNPMEKSELASRHPVAALPLTFLHSFVNKQIDAVRVNAYQEIKKGNVMKGLGNLVRWAGVMSLAGAPAAVVTNWMMGRDISDITAGDLAGNMMKTLGWSQYTIDKMKAGRPIEAAVGAYKLPYEAFDAIVRRDPKAIQYIPLVGPIIYNRYYGGNEKKEDMKKRRERQEQIEESATLREARDRRRERLEERRGY